MTLQQIAQEMLNRHGFFVIVSPWPMKAGSVHEEALNGGRVFPRSETTVKYVVAGEATYADLDKQYAVVGADRNGRTYPSWHLYRGIAE